MVSEAMNLRPPTSFSFTKVGEWPKWKQWFEQYRLASGLVEKDEQRQVITLLYCLGEEAEEVLNATRITEEEKKKYQRVIEQFDAYFQVRRNVKNEHARFNKCIQQPDKPVDRFRSAHAGRILRFRRNEGGTYP